MSKLRIWFFATRPKTLWAAISPVIIGIAMAWSDGFFHWPSALAVLLAAVLIQIGTNFANDYFDFIKGADTSERQGPTRATQAGLISPSAMKAAFVSVFGLALLIGIYIAWRGGWPIVVIGSVSIMLGVLYTATPFALAYTGFADIFVLIFFGPVAVAGTYYVQSLTITPLVVVAGLAPGLISTAILTVNNLRDIDQDRKADKKTLAVRFGKRFARFEYLLSLCFAGIIPVTLIWRTGEHFFSLVAMLSLLLTFPAVKSVFNDAEGVVLNEVLADTGKFLIIFSLLFSIGWNL